MPSELSVALRATAEAFLAANPPPGEVLVCAITGSHLYGFPSPDSDIDLKGIHQAPTAQVVSLFPGRSDHDRLAVFRGVECDLTTNELAPALRLLIKGNGNMLERIFSPLQLVDTPALHELRALATASLSKASAGHYRGYLKGMRREYRKNPRAKSLLYCVRVALTGAHLLENGVVEADLTALAEPWGFPEALELARFKVKNGEKVAPPAALARSLEARLDELDRLLTDALSRSTLPDRPPNVDALDAWLVGRRRFGPIRCASPVADAGRQDQADC